VNRRRILWIVSAILAVVAFRALTCTADAVRHAAERRMERAGLTERP